MSTQPLTPGARPEPSLPPAPTLATIVSVNDGPRPRSSAILYLGLAVVGIAVLASTLAFLGNFRLSHATMAQAPKVPQGTPIDPPAERLARFDIKPAAPTVSVAQVAAPEVLINAALPVVAPPVRDRYNGGIVIEPPVVAAKEAPKESLTLPDPPQEALDVLRRADLSQWGGAAIVGALGNAASAHTDARTDSKRPPSPTPGAASPITPRFEAAPVHGDRWLVLRGAHIECYLTLAYVSDRAGEAHCVVARDVYGRDGSRIVVDRGAIVNGSFRAISSLGDRRAFILWDRLVTPSGLAVALNSDATDGLGATGLAAEVENRWWDRIGVALAVSTVKDLTFAQAQQNTASGVASSTVAASQGFADQILAQTQAIKPSLYVRQGASASIVLRSDLDFSQVYGRKR